MDELRERLFSHADDRSLARCARVCKNWTDTCLEILWDDLSDIVPLLNVLSPMKLSSSVCR